MIAQELALKTMEAFNKHDADAFTALYAPEAIAHDPQYGEPLKGREAIRKDIQDFFQAFPDIHATVMNDPISNANAAALELEMTGTHRGPMTGPTGTIPATNRRMTMLVGYIVRINARGRIVENNRYYDLAGLMGQLGLM